MLWAVVVHIELTSTLTQEDENRLAPAILKMLSGVLEMLPVAYLVRIETADNHVYEQLNPKAVWDQGAEVSITSSPFVES